MEGFCSAIAGLLGCGHATTTFGGNIGAIGVTRVSEPRQPCGCLIQEED